MDSCVVLYLNDLFRLLTTLACRWKEYFLCCRPFGGATLGKFMYSCLSWTHVSNSGPAERTKRNQWEFLVAVIFAVLGVIMGCAAVGTKMAIEK